MANNTRLNSIWAENAVTNIPDVPVTGTAYRDESYADNYADGQQYDSIYNSARYNQFFYQVSSLLKELSEQGLLQWVSGQAYQNRAVVFHNNNVFIALRDIPATEEPVPEPGVSTAWLKLVWQAGKGLTTDYTNEAIQFNAGQGLSIDNDNNVNVNVGVGLKIVDDTIVPNAGRGITVNAEGAIEPMLGNGLDYDDDGNIAVIGAYKAGNGISITGTGDDQTISAKAGTGISINGDGSLYLNVGNGIKIDPNTNQINYDESYLLPLLKSQFLPLTGGTMTGSIQMSSGRGLLWKGGANIRCIPTGNNCDYGIDLASTVNDDGKTTATGTFFDVWSQKLSNYVFKAFADDGCVQVPYYQQNLSTASADPNTNNKVALSCGNPSGYHVEHSHNAIVAKMNTNTASNLYIAGNTVQIQSRSAVAGSNPTAYYVNIQNNGMFSNTGAFANVNKQIFFWNGGNLTTWTIKVPVYASLLSGVVWHQGQMWTFSGNSTSIQTNRRITGSDSCSITIASAGSGYVNITFTWSATNYNNFAMVIL